MTPAIIRTLETPLRFRVILGVGFYPLIETNFPDTLEEALSIKRQWQTVGDLDAWAREQVGLERGAKE